MDTISKQTYRRFLLGSQGLWPGRRYLGLTGTESALRQMQALQLDPLVMVARSQDIAMYGRVLDYKPDLSHAGGLRRDHLVQRAAGGELIADGPHRRRWHGTSRR